MIREDNIGFGNYHIYQDDNMFLYGTDAVILSCFTIKYGKKKGKAIDLGTNTGIVPTIILSKNKDLDFIGVDVQKEAIDLALLGRKRNGLDEKLNFINSDILDLKGKVELGSFDIVTCNPPYMEKGKSLDSETEEKMIARTETTANLEDFLRVGSSLLKDKGEFFMINRPYRLVDMFSFGRKYNLEPKKLMFISPRYGTNPNLAVIQFVKFGGKELTILPELSIREGDDYTSHFIAEYRDF